MRHKLKQFLAREKFTTANRLPQRHSRTYLLNALRRIRYTRTSSTLKAGLGLLRWLVVDAVRFENRVGRNSFCLISTKNRGVSQRFGVSRLKIKDFSGRGFLFGVRKSSW